MHFVNRDASFGCGRVVSYISVISKFLCVLLVVVYDRYDDDNNNNNHK